MPDVNINSPLEIRMAGMQEKQNAPDVDFDEIDVLLKT